MAHVRAVLLTLSFYEFKVDGEDTSLGPRTALPVAVMLPATPVDDFQ